MKLVNTKDYGIKGINYYWTRKDKFNLAEDELRSVGVKDNCALVDKRLLPKLKKANEIFKHYGFEIIIKDAYRSPELYQLVKKKRYEIDGKENTDKTLDSIGMPHSSGQVVDINLVKLSSGQEVEIWDKKDWPDGIFIDYYRYKTDAKSIEFQRLQNLMVSTMLSLGFKLGGKKEFWHFEYQV
jgi:D-alanyl-D-alanine dipeptidase